MRSQGQSSINDIAGRLTEIKQHVEESCRNGDPQGVVLSLDEFVNVVILYAGEYRSRLHEALAVLMNDPNYAYSLVNALSMRASVLGVPLKNPGVIIKRIMGELSRRAVISDLPNIYSICFTSLAENDIEVKAVLNGAGYPTASSRLSAYCILCSGLFNKVVIDMLQRVVTK